MNQDEIKTVAFYFELGLILGIEEKARVANWVDSIIKDAPDLKDWMLTLSLISQVKPADIISTLSGIDGTPDFGSVFRLVAARLGVIRPIVSKEDASLLRSLFELVHIEGFSSEDKAYIYQIDHGLDYALESIVDFSNVLDSYLELVAIGIDKMDEILSFDLRGT